MTGELPKILLEHWELPLALAAAGTYFVGYVRAAVFLRVLRVEVPPTEIYGLPSLFVSGLTGLIAASLVPALCLLVSWGASLRLPSDLRLWAALIVGLSVFLATWWALRTSVGRSPPGLQIFPRSDSPWPYLRLLSAAALGAVTFAGMFSSSIGVATAVAGWALWTVALMWTHISIARGISVGLSPGQLTQDPVMLGHLITRGRVSRRGNPINFSPDEKDAFQTSGLLLSWREGKVFFIPGTYAQEQLDSLPNSRLVVIPDSKVITFMQDPGVSERPGDNVDLG